MKHVLHRYEHGGGRVFTKDDSGSRDLIIDLYGDGERRDRIIDALVGAGIIPPLSYCEVIDV